MTAPPRLAGEGERGSGTVLAAGLTAVAATIAVAVSAIGAVDVARARAQAAADGAALAAALAEAGLRQSAPCQEAAALAARMDARLLECETNSGHARVRVSVPALAAAGVWEVSAHAHAGPG